MRDAVSLFGFLLPIIACGCAFGPDEATLALELDRSEAGSSAVDGRTTPVDIPSGSRSGLYIDQPFCLDAGREARLAFAVDLGSNLHEVDGR